MPAETLAFVQFIHPGHEHGASRSGRKEWNPTPRSHRRKFLLADGVYLLDGDRHEGLITFWGEWEPPSLVVAKHRPEGDLPRYLHKPILEARENFQGLQNTDPFVFGPRFLYTGCQQHTRKGTVETQLRRLTCGSVILFGSCWDLSRFVVDTVFVVADHVDHTLADHEGKLRGLVPDTYWMATLGPWYAGDAAARSYRLYLGATFDDPVGGMFSFVPCLPAGGEELPRFPRPEIRLPTVITSRLRQGKKVTKLDELSEARSLWEQVVHQVEDRDLVLGVRVDAPPFAAHTWANVGAHVVRGPMP